MLIFLLACTHATDSKATTDTSVDSPADTQGGDTDTGPIDNEPFELNVSAIEVGVTAPSEAHAIHIIVKAASQIGVIDSNFAQGCCPQAEVTASADIDTMVVTPVYTLTGDDCDCVTGLVMNYTLTGLPTGRWTVTYGDASGSADVP